jgi:hypothetical protein
LDTYNLCSMSHQKIDKQETTSFFPRVYQPQGSHQAQVEGWSKAIATIESQANNFIGFNHKPHYLSHNLGFISPFQDFIILFWIIGPFRNKNRFEQVKILTRWLNSMTCTSTYVIVYVANPLYLFNIDNNYKSKTF